MLGKKKERGKHVVSACPSRETWLCLFALGSPLPSRESHQTGAQQEKAGRFWGRGRAADGAALPAGEPGHEVGEIQEQTTIVSVGRSVVATRATGGNNGYDFRAG